MDLDWSALGLSLKVAGWATAINLVLGVALGALLARRRFPGRELLDSLLTLPMVLPPTVLGYYLLVLIGRNGPIGAWLQSWFGINLVFTWQAAVIAAAVASLPLVFKPARAAFEDVDGQLEQAARTYFAVENTLGLDRWRQRIGQLPTDSLWQSQARASARDDVYSIAGQLVQSLLSSRQTLAEWQEKNAKAIERVNAMHESIANLAPDLAPVSVALRELRQLG